MTSNAEGLARFLIEHPGARDSPVVHWIDGNCTLGELQAGAQTAADVLHAAGVAPGQPVVGIVDTGINALALAFGCWLADAVYVPLNGRLTDAELSNAIKTIRPAAVVGGQFTSNAAATIVEAGRFAWRTTSVARASTDALPTDTALIMRTSGTTGEAKPVFLSHTGVQSGIDTVLSSLRSTSRPAASSPKPAMANLIPSSLALWAGLWNALFALRAGAPLVLMDRFDAKEFATLIRRHEIRSCVLAPAMMIMLVDDPDIDDLAPLTMVRSITAPLTPHQAQAFRSKFGIGLMNCYGQTELGSEVVGWTPKDMKAFGDSKLGAVGRAHKNVELRVQDGNGIEVRPGDVGELWVRSPFMSAARDLADRLIDGFLQTGDLARIDEDSFLWLEGRLSDVINRGGMKVLPQEIEEVLRRIPGVTDACVAAFPDDRLGEVPVAWVRLAPGCLTGPAEITEQARSVLAGYKVPVAVEIVSDFPRNEIGKVLRRALVEDRRSRSR